MERDRILIDLADSGSVPAVADFLIKPLGGCFPQCKRSLFGPPLPPRSRDGAAAFGGITAARSARGRGSS
jgi:hypothetical protein